MEGTVRKATEKDIEALASIRDSIYRMKFTRNFDWFKEMYKHKDMNILVFDKNKDVIGFVMYSLEHQFIRDLNVKEGFRKQGIGAALIKEASRAFKENGVMEKVRYIPRENECHEMIPFLEHNTDNIEITMEDYLSDAFDF